MLLCDPKWHLQKFKSNQNDSLLALQDEQSALVMVKKHQTLEQALEDYAQTIHQLANSSRLMVTSEHPER